jgi:DNA-binding IclR family transcriptional regulator
MATAPTGWACIAGYEEAELAEVLKMLKRSDPTAWPSTERNIHQAFDEYRQHGFVLSVGVMHEQFNAVAVPIRSVNGGAVHGLSASGLASIWPREKLMEIGPELAALARDLSTVPA